MKKKVNKGNKKELQINKNEASWNMRNSEEEKMKVQEVNTSGLTLIRLKKQTYYNIQEWEKV